MVWRNFYTRQRPGKRESYEGGLAKYGLATTTRDFEREPRRRAD